MLRIVVKDFTSRILSSFRPPNTHQPLSTTLSHIYRGYFLLSVHLIRFPKATPPSTPFRFAERSRNMFKI